MRAFSSICNFAGTGDAATTPTASDHRRVAGHTAGAGQNAGGRVHAVDVFWVGFLANENHLLAGSSPFDSFSSGEGELAHGGTWRSRQTSGENLRPAFLAAGVEAWEQQLNQVASWDAAARR